MSEPNNEPNVEVTPEWAKQLQESLTRLPEQIKEALNPSDPQQDPEPHQDPEPPKKRKFLDWLL